MTNKEYFVITNIEGDTYVINYTREELENEINSETNIYFEFLHHVLPIDSNYWKGKVMIIKGEIVVPKNKEVVVRKVLP